VLGVLEAILHLDQIASRTRIARQCDVSFVFYARVPTAN